MPRMDKLSNYRTTWDNNGVTYVSTRIVSWDDNTVTLNSGGWQTATTKNKMNQAANQFGLGFGVYQRKGDWFVRLKDGSESPFFDGIRIPR